MNSLQSEKTCPSQRGPKADCVPLTYVFFQVVLLITDGRQTPFSDPKEPGPRQVSTAIKQRGIRIIAIGIGFADHTELRQYASKPEDTLVIPEFPFLSLLVVETRVLLLGPGKLVMMLD